MPVRAHTDVRSPTEDDAGGRCGVPRPTADAGASLLSGWLDRHAPDGDLGSADQAACALITVADAQVPEVEAFCADWDMTVRRTARGYGPWALLVVEGRPLPVRGFTEITAMYRR